MEKVQVDRQALHEAIHANANYLLRVMHEAGNFTYTENLNPEVQVDEKAYNILRHAGTLYSLLMYASWAKDESVYTKVFKSLEYLFEEYYCPINPSKNIYGILSEPLVSDHKKKNIVKLGANGLALIATSILSTRYPAMRYRDKIAELFKFISFMQLKSGQFYAKYDINANDYMDWESLYYPGEACLGLAFAYNLEKKPEYLDAATNGLKHLARKRKNSTKLPPDHWALIASSVLIKILDQLGNRKSDIEAIYHHAVQIINSLINEHKNHPLIDLEKKGWNLSYNTCQTATRMEGVIAMYPHIRDKKLKNYLREAIELSVQFLIHAQVKQGHFDGAMPKIHCYPLELNNMTAIAPDSTELRIDYNQHTLSAWITYDRLMVNH